MISPKFVHWNGMRYGSLEMSTAVFFTIPVEEVSHPAPFWDPRQHAILGRYFYWSLPTKYLLSFLEAVGQESREEGEYFTSVCIYKSFLQVTGSEVASRRQRIQVCQHLKVGPQGALMLPWDKRWGKKHLLSSRLSVSSPSYLLIVSTTLLKAFFFFFLFNGKIIISA